MKKVLLSVCSIITVGFLGLYYLMPGTMFDIFQKVERKTGGLQEKVIMVHGLKFN